MFISTLDKAIKLHDVYCSCDFFADTVPSAEQNKFNWFLNGGYESFWYFAYKNLTFFCFEVFIKILIFLGLPPWALFSAKLKRGFPSLPRVVLKTPATGLNHVLKRIPSRAFPPKSGGYVYVIRIHNLFFKSVSGSFLRVLADPDQTFSDAGSGSLISTWYHFQIVSMQLKHKVRVLVYFFVVKITENEPN